MKLGEILKLQNAIKEFCNTGISVIDINSMDNLVNTLHKEPIEVKVALLYMFHNCDNDFSYVTTETRNGITPIKFIYKGTQNHVDEFTSFLKTFYGENYPRCIMPDLRYIYQQFKDKVDVYTIRDICSYYIDLDDEHHLTQKDIEFLSIKSKEIPDHIAKAIRDFGYSHIQLIGFEEALIWKIYNGKSKLEPIEILNKYGYKKVETPTNENNGNSNVIVDQDFVIKVNAIEDALNELKSTIGVSNSSFNKEEFIDSMDDLINKYTQMPDWEKLQKWYDMVDEYSKIKRKYLEDNN